MFTYSNFKLFSAISILLTAIFFTATSISQAIGPKYGGPVDTPLDKKAILKIINQTVLR